MKLCCTSPHTASWCPRVALKIFCDFLWQVSRGSRASLVAWVHGSDPQRFWEQSAAYPEAVLQHLKVGVYLPPDLVFRAQASIGPIKLQQGLEPGNADSRERLEQALALANAQIALAETLYGSTDASDGANANTQLVLTYKMLSRYSQAVGDLEGVKMDVREQTRDNCARAVQMLASEDEEIQLATECYSKWTAKVSNERVGTDLGPEAPSESQGEAVASSTSSKRRRNIDL